VALGLDGISVVLNILCYLLYKQAIGVCNPAYSCAYPKPGYIGTVAAGRASGVKRGD